MNYQILLWFFASLDQRYLPISVDNSQFYHLFRLKSIDWARILIGSKTDYYYFPGRWFLTQDSVNFWWEPADSGRKITGIPCRNPVSVFGCRFCQVPVGSGRNRIRSPEYCFHVPSISDVFLREPARTSRPGLDNLRRNQCSFSEIWIYYCKKEILYICQSSP
jgi:hypothetical protein